MATSDAPPSRLSTRLAFLVAGFGVSSWAPLVPFAKQRLAVDDGRLGLLLLCLGIGSVVAMVRAGPLCSRYGCKPVILWAGGGIVALLPALAVVDTPAVLGLALFAFGAALGFLDVAMNIHAIEVERGAGVPLLSGFHALFSVGGFAGAAVVTLLLSLSLSPLVSTLICSATMLLMLSLAAPGLLPTVQEAVGASLAAPRGPVLLLAVLAAVMFLVEGALLDWSALLLTGAGLAEQARAGVGYAVFSIAMTVGRLGGDNVTARFGDRGVMFWGSLIAIAGLATLLWATRIDVALAAYVLIGLGASNVVPILFRRAGAQQAVPTPTAVAAITTAGYAGLLVGPAGVGFVSEAASLPVAFWCLAALTGLVPMFARAAAGAPPPQRAGAEDD